MILEIVSVYDQASDTYGNPQCVVSLGSAMRSFGDEVNRSAPDNVLSKHPGDFSLMHLGNWCAETAVYSLLDRPKLLIRAVDFVDKG